MSKKRIACEYFGDVFDYRSLVKFPLRFFLAICFVFVLHSTVQAQQPAVFFDFYNDLITIEFDHQSVKEVDLRFSEDGFRQFYAELDRSSFQSTVGQLTRYRSEFELNDWVYLELLEDFIDATYLHKDRMYRRALLWYLLNKSGYDSRITWIGSQIFVAVYSTEEIFETPRFTLPRGNFVNVSAVGDPDVPQDVYLLEFTPSPRGKSFSFSMERLPKLSHEPLIRVYEFDYNGQHYVLEAVADNTIIEIRKEYPGIQEREYIITPLSESSKSSLLPQLREAMKPMSQKQKIEFLITFTRQGLQYKEDDDFFGRNKPMIAEEALYYRYSDCEDRCALFYHLVQELLGLPVIIIAYPEHLSAAVQLDQNIGQPITYRGRQYTIADPTGPENVSDIGIYPNDTRRQSYSIIHSSH